MDSSFPTKWLLLTSADFLCKQFRPRSGQTKCWAWSRYKQVDIDSIPKEFLKMLIKKKNQQTTIKHANLHSMQRDTVLLVRPKLKVHNGACALIMCIENTRWVSFDIKFTRQGFENACWHREVCRAIQHAFSKPSLVNLISKERTWYSIYQFTHCCTLFKLAIMTYFFYFCVD